MHTAKLVAGGAKCTRCKKRDAKWEIEWGQEKLCHSCKQLAAVEDKRKAEQVPETNLLINKHTDNPATAITEKFIEHKLAGFDFSTFTIYVSLKHHKMKCGDVTVKWRLPKRPKGWVGKKWKPWMETRVLVRETLAYPHTKKLPMGVVQMTDPVAKAMLAHNDPGWFYEFEDIEFKDESEAFVFGAGHGIFKLLRKLKLIDGHASRVGMNKNGKAWLEEFRDWRDKDTPSHKSNRGTIAPKLPLIHEGDGMNQKMSAAGFKSWETRRKNRLAKLRGNR